MAMLWSGSGVENPAARNSVQGYPYADFSTDRQWLNSVSDLERVGYRPSQEIRMPNSIPKGKWTLIDQSLMAFKAPGLE
ncbi:hypothetical protein UCREL1_7219 [Eutypa lata UCREL1]|uniref:Uncharacterized protein n=1 Tax=Eutypa lata (strain UCR-EL1) TaxID=1287681 RepID=M7SHL5_EUTLA|nr:hypothetical protein UCREL1_7219 [Eutypa lata UCREL1]